MGLVLAFQTAPRPASSRQAQPQQRRPDRPQGADILFFTGVRYERRADASSAASSPSGGSPTAS